MKKMMTNVCAAAVAALLLSGAAVAVAQNDALPAALPAAPAGAPAATLTPRAVQFPPIRQENFTAQTPTVDTVNAFLKQLWGYDENRVWSVAGIFATHAPGVAKVVVYVGDKAHPERSTQTVFYTTPDGAHAIAGNVIDFGVTPFAATRKLLQDRADGPARGAASKELELVLFTDFQCAKCRDAEATLDQLAADFPQARIVWQNAVTADVHPFAVTAAAEGACVRQAKGDDAFFRYAQAVLDTQDSLTADGSARTLAQAALKGGADSTAMAACAALPASVEKAKASAMLARDAGVEGVPTLAVNGFLVPLDTIPYEVLKRIVVFRANQDGMNLKVQPSLKTLR